MAKKVLITVGAGFTFSANPRRCGDWAKGWFGVVQVCRRGICGPRHSKSGCASIFRHV